jgi:hypothetical protein
VRLIDRDLNDRVGMRTAIKTAKIAEIHVQLIAYGPEVVSSAVGIGQLAAPD